MSVTGIQSDISEMKTDIRELRSDVKALTADVGKVRLEMGDMHKSLSLDIEKLRGTLRTAILVLGALQAIAAISGSRELIAAMIRSL